MQDTQAPTSKLLSGPDMLPLVQAKQTVEARVYHKYIQLGFGTFANPSIYHAGMLNYSMLTRVRIGIISCLAAISDPIPTQLVRKTQIN